MELWLLTHTVPYCIVHDVDDHDSLEIMIVIVTNTHLDIVANVCLILVSRSTIPTINSQ